MRIADMERGGPDPNFNSQLCEAAWEGDSERVKELCLLGADIECFNDNGNTPLHLAIEQCEYDTVKVLLDLGAEVERRTELGGWTPLIHAVEIVSDAANQLGTPPDNRIICLLLEHGADVHKRSLEGETALTFARIYRNKEAEEILLAAGATE